MRRCLLLGILSFLIMHFGCSREVPEADLILRGGMFFTVCESHPIVEAVAVKGDRILAVGRNEEMASYVGEATRVMELDGAFGCPGFNDASVDFTKAAVCMTAVDLHGVTTLREVRRRVDQAIRRLPPSTWITGYGWDQSLFSDKAWPNYRDLDRVAWTVPVFLTRACGQAGWANSIALRIARITSETPDPPGGEIVKDPRTGRPTGILKGTAMNLIAQFIPEPTEEAYRRELMNLLDTFRRNGVTSAQISIAPEMAGLVEEVLEDTMATCRLSLNFPLRRDLKTYKILSEKYRSGFLRFGYLRGVLDGNLACQTALLSQPYLDAPAQRGIRMMGQETLDRLVLDADREGFQVGLVAKGDEAHRMSLEAFAFADRMNGQRERRNRVEDVRLVSETYLSRMRNLDVVTCLQPALMLNDLSEIDGRLGPQRSRLAHAWRSLKSNGAVLAFGTGWPMGKPDPFLGLYVAVTRKDTAGHPVGGWHAEERLSIQEALEAFTLGAATAEFMDKEKGSLEVGKLADIVILDTNVLTVSPEKLRETRVLYTIVGGEVVYATD